MFKSVDINCPACGLLDQLVDVPSGANLPDDVTCDACGAEAKRVISAGILKKQIEERTHGGELVGGKVVRKATGWKAASEQHELNVSYRAAVKRKKYEEAASIHKELNAKKDEAKKNIGKAQQ